MDLAVSGSSTPAMQSLLRALLSGWRTSSKCYPSQNAGSRQDVLWMMGIFFWPEFRPDGLQRQ